jgi:hypothetical protein
VLTRQVLYSWNQVSTINISYLIASASLSALSFGYTSLSTKEYLIDANLLRDSLKLATQKPNNLAPYYSPWCGMLSFKGLVGDA